MCPPGPRVINEQYSVDEQHVKNDSLKVGHLETAAVRQQNLLFYDGSHTRIAVIVSNMPEPNRVFLFYC